MEFIFIALFILVGLCLAIFKNQFVYFFIVILSAWVYKLSKNIESLEIETSDLKTLVASLVKPS